MAALSTFSLTSTLESVNAAHHFVYGTKFGVFRTFLPHSTVQDLTTAENQAYLKAAITEVNEIYDRVITDAAPYVEREELSHDKKKYYWDAIQTSENALQVYKCVTDAFKGKTGIPGSIASIVEDAARRTAQCETNIARFTELRAIVGEELDRKEAERNAAQIAARAQKAAPSLPLEPLILPRPAHSRAGIEPAAIARAPYPVAVAIAPARAMTGDITVVFNNREHLPEGRIQIRGKVPGMDEALSWDASHPIRLADEKDPSMITTRLPRYAVHYEFKFVLVQNDGRERWQMGPNLKLSDMPTEGSSTILEVVFE